MSRSGDEGIDLTFVCTGVTTVEAHVQRYSVRG